MGINPIAKKYYAKKERQGMLKGRYNQQCKKAVVKGIISSVFIFLGIGVAALAKDPSVLEKLVSFISVGAGLIGAISCKDSIESAIETKNQLDEEFPENEL